MQCASCKFENMPGTTECGRCGTSMLLATAQLDVNPPRARKAVKRLRTLSGGKRLFRWPLRNRAPAPRPVWNFPGWTPHVPTALFWRLAVPGWAHFYRRQQRRGRIFLGIYLLFLVLAILATGMRLQMFLLSAAFSTHASAIVDVILPLLGPASGRRRFAYAIGCMVLLFFTLYLPVGWLVTRVASPELIMVDSPPFRAGDGVVVNRWAFIRSVPVPGQVVFYMLRRVYNHYDGERIDRILAGPGDRVRIDEGKVFVNDQASSLLPLNPPNMPKHMAYTVPDGSYCILPSGIGGAGMDEDIWADIATVPQGNIRGVVYLRMPLNRFLIIR